MTRNIIVIGILVLAGALLFWAFAGCNPPPMTGAPDPPASEDQQYEPDWEPPTAPTDDEVSDE